MLKPALAGVAACAALLAAAAWSQRQAQAQIAQAQITQAPIVQVPSQCPGQPDWTVGFQFDELIPLGKSQYKAALINGDRVNVRPRHGTADNIPTFTLSAGDPVTVTGETWTAQCEQWMRVNTDRGSNYWIRGDYIALQEPAAIGGPKELPETPPGAEPEFSLPPEQVLITSQCPEATWTEGFRFYELIELARWQYRPSSVVASEVNLRDGVGFEAAIVQQLPQGTPLVVTGEAWDGGCNQWMRVRIEAPGLAGDRHYWVSGRYIQ
jgi:SH3-like domain-containing protein